MLTGRKAITFNASGLSKKILDQGATLNGLVDKSSQNINRNWQARNDLVTAYHVKGDELTHMQTSSLLPDAIGRSVELPNPPGLWKHPIDSVQKGIALYETENKQINLYAGN
jgi:hypothetical protein